MSVRRCRARASQPRPTPAFTDMKKWPMRVSCYGRRYEVNDDAEFAQLMRWLTDGLLMLANRYRVGKTWPRGERAKPVESRTYWRGTRVWFYQQSFGYGYQSHDVPAVFLRRVSQKRWEIELELGNGSTKRVFVSPKNVRRRDEAAQSPAACEAGCTDAVPTVADGENQ